MNLSQPATSSRKLLEEALADARFVARVEAGDGGALDLVVLSHKAPFDRAVAAAREWLAEAGIDGSAAFNDLQDVVLTLPTSGAVERLVEVLLEPHIRAYTTITQLGEALEDHGLLSNITAGGTCTVELGLSDEGLASAVELASLLGAPSINGGLDLSDLDGMDRLADRLQWLISGVVGSEVSAKASPGCAHEQEEITLYLTVEQARGLTQRLVCSARNASSAAATVGVDLVSTPAA
ncbi:hypothetical protein [Streptomyces glaucus]|uniref:Uncharacterized protein n=1 Tax=Streptomyces glaucus TaxID=284029 RepID=A0ABP5X178_9ACTN